MTKTQVSIPYILLIVFVVHSLKKLLKKNGKLSWNVILRNRLFLEFNKKIFRKADFKTMWFLATLARYIHLPDKQMYPVPLLGRQRRRRRQHLTIFVNIKTETIQTLVFQNSDSVSENRNPTMIINIKAWLNRPMRDWCSWELLILGRSSTSCCNGSVSWDEQPAASPSPAPPSPATRFCPICTGLMVIKPPRTLKYTSTP